MTDFQGPRCETCKFFFIDGEAMLCRRHPPTVVVIPTPKQYEFKLQSCFPTMLPSGWCGEHRAQS